MNSDKKSAPSDNHKYRGYKYENYNLFRETAESCTPHYPTPIRPRYKEFTNKTIQGMYRYENLEF